MVGSQEEGFLQGSSATSANLSIPQYFYLTSLFPHPQANRLASTSHILLPQSSMLPRMQEMVAEGSNKLHFSIHQGLSVIVKDELPACHGIIQVACDLEATRGETEAWWWG